MDLIILFDNSFICVVFVGGAQLLLSVSRYLTIPKSLKVPNKENVVVEAVTSKVK